MADTLSNYNFGGGGCNLVKNPLQLATDEATQLQNAELIPDANIGGKGALSKRGGLAALNGSALAGSILGMIGLNLKTSYTRTLYAARGTEDANTFMTSTNGTSWSDSSSALAHVSPASLDDQNGTRDAHRFASFKNFLVYPSNDYTSGSGKPPINLWDGTNALEIAEVPFGPSGTAETASYAITDMIVANGKIYFATHEQGGSTPNLCGRVLSLNLQTGLIHQIANSFGAGTGEMTGGYPSCLCWYQNQLFVGLNNGATTDGIGKIVRCYPDIDTDWTSDTATLVSSISSLCIFKGDLYVGAQSSASTGARLYKRAAATQAYTTQLTSASGAGGDGHYGHLIVYSDELYAVEYFSGGTDVVHIIKSSDGTTFATDRDVDSVDGVDATTPQMPGGALVLSSALYYVFRATTATATDGYILRKASGTWTKVVTDNFGGPINVLVMRA